MKFFQCAKGFLYNSKQGVVLPFGELLSGILRIDLESYIEAKLLESQGIFNDEYICNLVNNYISGIEDKSMQVWCFFYTFQKWYLNTYLIFNI